MGVILKLVEGGSCIRAPPLTAQCMRQRRNGSPCTSYIIILRYAIIEQHRLLSFEEYINSIMAFLKIITIKPIASKILQRANPVSNHKPHTSILLLFSLLFLPWLKKKNTSQSCFIKAWRFLLLHYHLFRHFQPRSQNETLFTMLMAISSLHVRCIIPPRTVHRGIKSLTQTSLRWKNQARHDYHWWDN